MPKSQDKNYIMYLIKINRTRPLHDVILTLVCWGPLFYLQFFDKKGPNSKNIAFSCAPCVATAPCHNEQVFQVLY